MSWAIYRSTADRHFSLSGWDLCGTATRFAAMEKPYDTTLLTHAFAPVGAV